MVSVSLILIFLIIPALGFIYFLVKTSRKLRAGEPLVVKGSLIWGSAKEFGLHAVNYLHKCQKTYGDVFTLRLVNQHLTVLMNPNDYDEFTKQKTFDFDKIQKQVNWNVFNFIIKDPIKMIAATVKTHKGAYMNRAVDNYVGNTEYAINNVIQAATVDSDGWCHQPLKDFCARTVFNAVFNTIFGRSDGQTFNSYMAYQNFDIFHKYFNYFWLGFPKKWFPSAMKSLLELIQQPSSHDMMMRPDSSEYVKTVIKLMQEEGQSESDIIGHNLVYLHVNYNTLRLSFWIMNNIIQDDMALKDLKEEIDDVIEGHTEDGVATFEMSDIENLPVLDSIMKESARLASGVFVIRYIKEDTWFNSQNGNKYLMRAGDRITMYPPAYHKDPEVFAKPHEFQYDRFIDTKFFKNDIEIKHPVIPFGALCPGKKLATFHMKWYILSMINQFDLRSATTSGAEYDFTCHGHEVLPPVNDIDFSFKMRENRPVLKIQH